MDAIHLSLFQAARNEIQPFVELLNFLAMHFVYILKCADSSYYTACTNNIDARLERHNNGFVHYSGQAKTIDQLWPKLIHYANIFILNYLNGTI